MFFVDTSIVTSTVALSEAVLPELLLLAVPELLVLAVPELLVLAEPDLLESVLAFLPFLPFFFLPSFCAAMYFSSASIGSRAR